MEFGCCSVFPTDGLVTHASWQFVCLASLCTIRCARDARLPPVDGSLKLCDASDGSQASVGGALPKLYIWSASNLLDFTSVAGQLQVADGGKGEISAAYEVFNELIGVFTPMIWVTVFTECFMRRCRLKTSDRHLHQTALIYRFIVRNRRACSLSSLQPLSNLPFSFELLDQEVTLCAQGCCA